MLYICGTPIGNLEDITLRQLRILQEVDLIAAEDTRHTKKLLNHYNINTPLISFYEHNQHEKSKVILQKLQDNKNIALVTDAGMPCISDPGFLLVTLCYNNNIKVTTVPGPTAVISGLVLSGLPTDRYVFEGFLPKNKKEKQQVLTNIANEKRTIVLYEAPHRLIKTLTSLSQIIDHNRKISIVREITKIYEEVKTFDVHSAIKYYSDNLPLGEIVIVIEGAPKEDLQLEIKIKDLIDNVTLLVEDGFSKNEAIKQTAKNLALAKKIVYNAVKDIKFNNYEHTD